MTAIARAGRNERLRNRGNPNGFSRVTAPAMAAAIRRANNKDLARLKDLLERRPHQE